MADHKYTGLKKSSTSSGTKVHLIGVVFRDVIEQNLILDPKLLSAFDRDGLITPEDHAAIQNKIDQVNMIHGVQLLLQILGKEFPEEKFISCLKESDDGGNQDIAYHILGEKRLPVHTDGHSRFLEEVRRNSPELIDIIKPTDMINQLPTLGVDKRVAIENEEDRRGSTSAAALLLIHLRRSASSWPVDFLKAFKANGYNDDMYKILEDAYNGGNDTVPTKSNRSNAEKELVGDVKSMTGGHSESKSGDDLDRDLKTSLQSSADPAPLKLENFDNKVVSSFEGDLGSHTKTDVTARSDPDFKMSSQPTLDSSDSNNDVSSSADMGSQQPPGKTYASKSEKFYDTLREYQRTLAEPALKKLNTVLVSPTGTGKTHVAAYIIDKHLTELEELNGKGRVVFLVPAVRLAKQQRDKLDELIGSPTRDIRCVVGQDIDVNCTLLSVMSAENVCITVMTAQLLLNGLQEQREDNRVSWEDISLLVIDECHNTQKGHAYNKIMKEYLRRKKGKEGKSSYVPQIVGMTANLGTGRRGSTEEAMKHIFEVCANLDATVIQPVTYDEDLLTYLNVPEDIGPVILQPRTRDAFRVVLEDIMEKIEQKIRSTLGEKRNDDVKPPDPISSCARDSQNYENWIAQFRNTCTENRESYTGPQYRALIAYLDNLMVYQQALCIHRDVRPKNALRHLEAEMIDLEFKRGESNDDLIELYKGSKERLEIAITRTDENPLLKWVKEKLVETFKKDPKSGVLLFTRTRAYTKALLEWLLEEKAIQELDLKPARVTGTQDPDMTKSEGDTILANFRVRKHKIIVATNVLEEGIDLSACNLVIRHNYVPSETGHTQVKGRGRAEDSQSFLVALSETGRNFRQQELENRMREEWAHKIMETIATLVVREKIQALQTAHLWLDEHAPNANEGQDPSDWRLLCLKCPQDVCSTDQVVCFRGSKFVVTSSDFKDKCKITRYTNPRMIKSNESMNGKIYCGNCRQDWGSWCTYDSQNLPIIKIDGFAIKNVKTQEIKKCKKWKQVPFKVLQVNDIEVMTDIGHANLFNTD